MVYQPPMMNIVAKSPFKNLQKHMHHCHKSVQSLVRFIDMALDLDWDGAEEQLLSVSACESKADTLKVEICNYLHKDLFLPVSKAQIVALLMQQEALANLAEDTAGLVYGRKMEFPSVIANEIRLLMQNALTASDKAAEVVAELNRFLESGFSGFEQKITESLIDDINRIESESDILQRTIREKIFVIESSLSPVEAVFLYELVSDIGGLADIAQKIGLQLIILVSK